MEFKLVGNRLEVNGNSIELTDKQLIDLKLQEDNPFSIKQYDSVYYMYDNRIKKTSVVTDSDFNIVSVNYGCKDVRYVLKYKYFLSLSYSIDNWLFNNSGIDVDGSIWYLYYDKDRQVFDVSDDCSKGNLFGIHFSSRELGLKCIKDLIAAKTSVFKFNYSDYLVDFDEWLDWVQG